MNIKLYHAKHTRSLRVLWLLEEMGLRYELEVVKLALGNTGGEDFAKVNPLQKVPAISVDGEVLQESTAILEFLANKFAAKNLLITTDHSDYGRFLQWLHGGESGFGMYLSIYFGNTVLLPENQRSKAMALWAEENLTKMLKLFSESLAQRKYIAGDRFTISDISVGYILYGISLLGKQEKMAPENVQNWWQLISERPAFQKALSA